MTSYIVDASVVAKWFIPEENSDKCDALLSDEYELYAPDLLWSELGSILCKKTRSGEIDSEFAQRVLSLMQEAPIEIIPSYGLMDSAYEIAIGASRSFYDSMYLAAGESRETVLVTADKKLVNGIRGTQWEHATVLIDSI